MKNRMMNPPPVPEENELMPQTATAAAGADAIFDFQREMMLGAFDNARRLSKVMEIFREQSGIEFVGTPHEIVHRENHVRLLRYRRASAGAHRIPIILVYALVNKPYIMDLRPDRSIVRSLLAKGFDVYMVDWGEPTPEDRYVDISDHVNGYIDRAVDAARKASGADQVTLLGYCMGGTLCTMYAALHQEKVRNLVIMAAPIDFEKDSGLLRFWADGRFFDVDKVVDNLGNVPSSFLNAGFTLLDPYNNVFGKYLKLAENVDDEDAVDLFMRMERWINDGVDVAGETYREFIKHGYQSNLLVKGKWKVGVETVDLTKINVPLCVIVADYDTLVPKEATLPLLDATSSTDKKLLSLPKGHIGLSVSSEAHRHLWPEVAEWLGARSAEAASCDIKSRICSQKAAVKSKTGKNAPTGSRRRAKPGGK